MSSRGKFIVIEGADGVGSTTQSKLLVEALLNRGISATYTAEPSSGEIGKFTRSSLRGGGRFSEKTLALLFAADRLEHYENIIAPALASGITVVSDRYTLSSFAYQTIGGTSLEWLKQINCYATPADYTFLISLAFEDAWQRIKNRITAGGAEEDMFDKRDKQAIIHKNYSDMLAHVHGIVIDGSGSPQEILEKILDKLAISEASDVLRK